ncbi:hypothetical protein [Burkholderia stabilis]|uniref:hypothetical protein n=1 Tax=Burkholderia stabilis TaxID=95485 RepID=UPI001F4AC910|nr:hypothetical protein [Burkholderia stabilis]
MFDIESKRFHKGAPFCRTDPGCFVDASLNGRTTDYLIRKRDARRSHAGGA